MKKLALAAFALLSALPFTQALAQDASRFWNEVNAMAKLTIGTERMSLAEIRQQYSPPQRNFQNEIFDFALSLYTGPFHQQINNDESRYNNTNKLFRSYKYPNVIGALKGALNALPPYVGDVHHVRTTTDVASLLGEMRALQAARRPYAVPFFFSTSAGPIALDGEVKNVRFLIKTTCTGRQIDQMSVNPKEIEVLFQPNAQFAVTNVPAQPVQYGPWQIWEFELKEIGCR